MGNRNPARPCRLRGLAGLFVVASMALLIVAGCTGTPQSPPPKPHSVIDIGHPTAVSAFAGRAACASCHPAQAKAHRGGRHATTLRTMDRRSLGDLAPPPGRIAGTHYAIQRQGDRFRAVMADDPARGAVIDLAFGSGKLGMTYATALGRDVLAQVRMSYVPHGGTWYSTPGQEGVKDRKLGKRVFGEFARRCVQCHAVVVPENSLIPEPNMMGVGCEACHGAGSDHIAAMRAGRRADLHIVRLSREAAPQINELCNRCHTVGQAVTEEDMQRAPNATRRFPLYGLRKSLCFVRTAGSLSCLTCHDPHKNVNTDPTHYEAICRTCHAAPSSFRSSAIAQPAPGVTTVPGAAAAHPGKVCPVNARRGCVGCHMPLGRIMPGSDIPTQVRDHYIHIEHSPKR